MDVAIREIILGNPTFVKPVYQQSSLGYAIALPSISNIGSCMCGSKRFPELVIAAIQRTKPKIAKNIDSLRKPTPKENRLSTQAAPNHQIKLTGQSFGLCDVVYNTVGQSPLLVEFFRNS